MTTLIARTYRSKHYLRVVVVSNTCTVWRYQYPNPSFQNEDRVHEYFKFLSSSLRGVHVNAVRGLSSSSFPKEQKNQIMKTYDEKEMSPQTRELAESILSSNKTSSTTSTSTSTSIFNQRRALSKAITLIESRSPYHLHQGDLLLNYLIDQKIKAIDQINSNDTSGVISKDNSCTSTTTTTNEQMMNQCRQFRIGIAGPPGAGKSTFIESFGIFLLDELQNHRKKKDQNENDVDVCTSECEKYDDENTKEKQNLSCDNDIHVIPSKLAVLCIDPSSTLTGGSILGDKTRMMELSRHPRAFVRPSPSRGDLGGVSSYTNDVITLCQASGYDLVMVESVGIGQSEVDIGQVVDMLILMVAPGGGDGLQGVKKGIVEVADMLVVNKADGSLLTAARTTAADYKGATHLFRTKSPPVVLTSAMTKDGFIEIWDEICKYRAITSSNGDLDLRKAKQRRFWMWKHMQDLISAKVQSDDRIGNMAFEMEKALDHGLVSPRVAASNLLECLHLTFTSNGNDNV
mmetsp:Transcript_26873/g.33178  ORF Transcript_26873/g.33178 Transcript_26873/m.33178 type:complete len:515 (+) Transcript_26873:190-1734(+)